MNSPTQYVPNRTHPLVIIGAIALILLSAAGIAAIMGWLPQAHSSSTTAESPANTANAISAPKTASSAPAPAMKPATSGIVLADGTGRTRDQICVNCGNVESITPFEIKGQGSGVGAVIGGVLGGVLGHQVGGGRGKDLTTAAGAIGGAVAGNEVEKNRNASLHYKVRVHLDDGNYRTITTANIDGIQAGDRVRLEASGIARISLESSY